MEYLCVKTISNEKPSEKLFIKGNTYRKISKNIFIAEDNKTAVHLFDDLIEKCFVKINPNEIGTWLLTADVV